MKSPTIKAELFVFSFLYIYIFMYFGTIIKCINVYHCYTFWKKWSYHHYKISLVTVFTKVYFVCYWYNHSSFLVVAVCMIYFLYPFTFNLHLSLNLKCLSCGQHTARSCFCFLAQPDNPCLLIHSHLMLLLI